MSSPPFFSSSKLNIIDRLRETVVSCRLPSNGSADKHEPFQDKLTVHIVISLACGRKRGLFMWKPACQNYRGVSEAAERVSQLCSTAAAAASHVLIMAPLSAAPLRTRFLRHADDTSPSLEPGCSSRLHQGRSIGVKAPASDEAFTPQRKCAFYCFHGDPLIPLL